MTNQYEDLVGPQSEDRGERVKEDQTVDGKDIWLAFLKDPEAPNISKEEAQDAKNALAEMKQNNPEIISICTHKDFKECRKVVHSIGSDSAIAA